jgi:hypothetical protein
MKGMSVIQLKESIKKSSIVTIVSTSIDVFSSPDTLIAERLVLDLKEPVGMIKSYRQKNFIIISMNEKGELIKLNMFIDKYRIDDSKLNYDFIDKIRNTYQISILFLSIEDWRDINKLKNQALEHDLTIVIYIEKDVLKSKNFTLADLNQYDGLEIASDSIFFAESSLDEHENKSIRLLGMKNRYGKLETICLS